MISIKRPTGYLMILASAIGFGSYGVWAKLMGNSFGVYSQAWIRSAIILIILVPIGIKLKAFRPIDRADWGGFSLVVLFTVFTVAPIYYAFNHLPIGIATISFYSLFLTTTYVAGWIMGERVTLIKVIAFGLAIAGLLLSFNFSFTSVALLAFALAALNGVASGGEVSFSKLVTAKYSTIQVTAASWASILVTHACMAVITHDHIPPLRLDQAWLALIAFAAAAAVAFWLVVEGFKYIDASIGGLIGLSELVFSIVFGLVLFGQHITLRMALGAACILLAGMLPDLVALRRSKTQPVPVPNPL